MTKQKLIISIILLSFFAIGCSPTRKGMRKSRKRDCDCPSFGQIEQTKTYLVAYNA